MGRCRGLISGLRLLGCGLYLVWGTNYFFTPALSSSSLIEADSSMGLLLGESTEFVLGHLVGGVVFVPRLSLGGGSPGVQVDCRVASGCLDTHLRVNHVLGHLDSHQYISFACSSPRGRNFWSLDSWRSC